MAARKQYELLSSGDLAPGFRLQRLEGGEASLSDLLRTGPILLVFYKVTCPVCQMALPYLQRIHAASAMPIYAISQHDAADTREFNEEFGITIPTLLDSEEANFPASNAYGISHVPSTFLIGADGKILTALESWNRAEREAIASGVGVTLVQATDKVPAFRAG